MRNAGNVYAVILVGGKGKRLRPLSTASRPKAFISVTADRKTMFRNTLDRVRSFAGNAHIIVVANKAHKGLVKKDFRSIGRENLLLEPVSRNTAPAIALAARRVMSLDADGIMVVTHSDQYIIGRDDYISAVKAGIDFMKDGEPGIVIIGIKPDAPSTYFGYIKAADSRSAASPGRKVEEFVEKPDRDTAKKYLSSGRYLWNAGVFIFRADTILKAFDKLAPEIASLLDRLGRGMKDYRRMPDISIDHAVMEKAPNISCVEGAYSWIDLGTFEDLKEVLARENRKFIVRGKKVVKIL